MRIETLIATIDQTDHTLVSQMNIQTDALVGNQCKVESTDEFSFQGNRITYLNTKERGVGRNRNLLIEHASADICIFADDDMRFVDGYPQIAKTAFEQCPKADILVFNLIEKNPRRYINQKITRIHGYNYAKYGAARIALRREPLQKAGIRFRLSFGGGTKYGSGEDTIFLNDCLKKGLKIYAVPYALAGMDQEAASTWFSGYDDKFFRDKGALYACLHPHIWMVYTLRFLIRYRKKFGETVSLRQAAKKMLAGGRAYKNETEE